MLASLRTPIVLAPFRKRSMLFEQADCVQDVNNFIKTTRLPKLIAYRVLAHCSFKLQTYHHGSERVMGLLSNTLRRDVLMHMYAGLLGYVSLFAVSCL